jgi:hypothetical protein
MGMHDARLGPDARAHYVARRGGFAGLRVEHRIDEPHDLEFSPARIGTPINRGGAPVFG